MHLNYKPSDAMPNLRKLVRPTDWEKVRAKITKYVEHSERHEPVATAMRSMWIRRLDKPGKYMQSKKAMLYFSSTGRQKQDDRPSLRRLWLNLSGWTLDEQSCPDRPESAPSEMESISEQNSDVELFDDST